MRDEPRFSSHGARHLPGVRAALGGAEGWVVDFGCGEGIFADVSAKWVGLDRDARWSAGLAAVGRPALTADIHHVPLRDGSAGGVLCMNVLQGVRDPEGVLREILRVLRAGGRAYLKNRWHKGGGDPRGSWERLRKAFHLHHLRFWSHPWGHPEGAVATEMNPDGTRAICPRCVRRFFERRGCAVERVSPQVFVVTRNGI